MSLREANVVRMDMHDKIFRELLNMCKRYLESLKIKVSIGFCYIDNNCWIFQFEFKERHMQYMEVAISMMRYDLIFSIRLSYSDKTVVTYNKYYKSSADTRGQFMQNSNKCATRKLFMSAKKFAKYINHVYTKFYNTDYYNNLQSVTTFLLICKHKYIFPKDIYLLIAKKIIFFVWYKIEKRKRETK